jgi:hypothetical protein
MRYILIVIGSIGFVGSLMMTASFVTGGLFAPQVFAFASVAVVSGVGVVVGLATCDIVNAIEQRPTNSTTRLAQHRDD